MLKRLFLMLCVVLISNICVADTILKIATLAPDSTTWMKGFRQSADRIERDTAGRVKIKYYPGGVMGNDQAVLRKMRIGQLQGGAITGGSMSEVYPDAQIYSMPMQFRSVDEVNYVRERMDPMIAEGLKKKGLILLGMSNGGFAHFAGAIEAHAIEDLKKQRVWLPQGDKVGAAMYKAAGISPVPLPIPDVYTALETGMLDTVVANPASIIAFQWHSKIKYFNDSPVIFLVGMIAVNKSAFDKISAADQKIVLDEMGKTSKSLDQLNRQDNLNAREVLKKSGVEFIAASAEEQKRWDGLAVIALEELKQQGAYSMGFLGAMQKYIAEYRDQQASTAQR